MRVILNMQVMFCDGIWLQWELGSLTFQRDICERTMLHVCKPSDRHPRLNTGDHTQQYFYQHSEILEKNATPSRDIFVSCLPSILCIWNNPNLLENTLFQQFYSQPTVRRIETHRPRISLFEEDLLMAWCETVTLQSHCLNLYGFLTRSNFEGTFVAEYVTTSVFCSNGR
jgi:hypothetical protein